MDKERFEIIMGEQGHWGVKDNQQSPHLLDLYKCCVRMNSFFNKINELESKLAKFKSYKTDDERIRDLINLYGQYKKENTKLKQQLAEKEKEIQRTHNYYQAVRNRETIRESKISFAVEKLSDVRSFISDATEIKEPDYTKVCNYIDNQIKQLKEKVE